MRDVNRIGPMLELISEIWGKRPDLRLGQLIENVVDAEYLYQIEDDKLAERLKLFYVDNR